MLRPAHTTEVSMIWYSGQGLCMCRESETGIRDRGRLKVGSGTEIGVGDCRGLGHIEYDISVLRQG